MRPPRLLPSTRGWYVLFCFLVTAMALTVSQVDFHITNVTNWLGPDGVRKHALLING
jgi:hypothetical protein